MTEALGLLDIHDTRTDNEDGQYATVRREFGDPRHRWYNHSVQSWVELFNTPWETGTATIAIRVPMHENAMIGEVDGRDEFDNKILKMFNELRTTTTTTTTPPAITIPVRSDDSRPQPGTSNTTSNGNGTHTTNYAARADGATSARHRNGFSDDSAEVSEDGDGGPPRPERPRICARLGCNNYAFGLGIFCATCSAPETRICMTPGCNTEVITTLFCEACRVANNATRRPRPQPADGEREPYWERRITRAEATAPFTDEEAEEGDEALMAMVVETEGAEPTNDDTSYTIDCTPRYAPERQPADPCWMEAFRDAATRHAWRSVDAAGAYINAPIQELYVNAPITIEVDAASGYRSLVGRINYLHPPSDTSSLSSSSGEDMSEGELSEGRTMTAGYTSESGDEAGMEWGTGADTGNTRFTHEVETRATQHENTAASGAAGKLPTLNEILIIEMELGVSLRHVCDNNLIYENSSDSDMELPAHIANSTTPGAQTAENQTSDSDSDDDELPDLCEDTSDSDDEGPPSLEPETSEDEAEVEGCKPNTF